MIKNKLREKILKGEKAVGVFSCLTSIPAIECLGLSGLDFIIIDTEHGPFDVETYLPMILTAERRDIVPLVRIKDNSRSSVLKALDSGGMGLVVPFIKSVDEVKKVIEYGKFVPMGQRGGSAARISDYGMALGDVSAYFEACNRETLVIPQCETAEALECIEEIVAIDGVAGIFIGPFDLSVALGKAGQFNDPIFIAAVDRVLKACKASGKFCMALAMSSAAARDYFAQGFEGVVSGDFSFLLSGVSQFVKEAKS